MKLEWGPTLSLREGARSYRLNASAMNKSEARRLPLGCSVSGANGFGLDAALEPLRGVGLETQIFGGDGREPAMIISAPNDYRKAAERRLPRLLFDYIDGGR
jgi:hypothetical protein